eukprot:Platyproteum_vivax@DN2606_c0_g1_i1.p1
MGQEQGKLWVPVVKAPFKLCEVIADDSEHTIKVSSGDSMRANGLNINRHQIGYPSTDNFPIVDYSPVKKALIIAVNYSNTTEALAGCHNDANALIPILKDLGFAKEDVRILADMDIGDNQKHIPTRLNILKGLDWLAEDCEAGDVRCVFFMGLSAEVAASPYNPSQRVDVLLPCDFQQGGLFSCISERDIVQSFSCVPAGVQIAMFLDSSVHWNLRDPTFGGAVGSADKISRQKAARLRKGCSDARARYSSRISAGDFSILDGGRKINPSPLACDVYCFSSVRSGQVGIECEIEGSWQGVFMYLVCEVLADRIERAARTGHFRLTFSSLYQELGAVLSQLKTTRLQNIDQDIYFSHTVESGASSLVFLPNSLRSPHNARMSLPRTSEGQRLRPPPTVTPPRSKPSMHEYEDFWSQGSSMNINLEGSAASSAATATPSETPYSSNRRRGSFFGVDEKSNLSCMRNSRRNGQRLISGCLDERGDIVDRGSYGSQDDIPPPPPDTPPPGFRSRELKRRSQGGENPRSCSIGYQNGVRRSFYEDDLPYRDYNSGNRLSNLSYSVPIHNDQWDNQNHNCTYNQSVGATWDVLSMSRNTHRTSAGPMSRPPPHKGKLSSIDESRMLTRGNTRFSHGGRPPVNRNSNFSV